MIESANWNCVAAYDNVKHDALRPQQRPVVEVPETNAHTKGARAQYGAAIPILFSETVEDFQKKMEFHSTDFTTTAPPYTGASPKPFPMRIDTDVLACGE